MLVVAAAITVSAMGCVYVMHQREFRPAELKIVGIDPSHYPDVSVWVLERQLAFEISTALQEGSFPIERLGSPVAMTIGRSGSVLAVADGYSIRACEARPLGIPTSRNKSRPLPLLVVVIQPGSSPEYTVVEVLDARHATRYSVNAKDGGFEVLEVISGHPTIDIDRKRAGDRITVQMLRTSRFDS